MLKKWVQQKTQGGIIPLKFYQAIHPWSNAFKRERSIRKVPVGNWSNLELQRDFGMADWNLNPTVHCIYKWDGEIPESIMSGEMSGISQFFEFAWFKWLIFWYKIAAYPDNHFGLGRYWEPTIDVGMTMSAKIIKENGQVLHRLTYQALTWDEWDREECKDESRSLMELLYQRLGLRLQWTI